jgi:hypothetical protein
MTLLMEKIGISNLQKLYQWFYTKSFTTVIEAAV